MDTGQINMMPVAAALPTAASANYTAQPALGGDQNSSSFAGMLLGMSSLASTATATIVDQANLKAPGAMEEISAKLEEILKLDVQPEDMTAMLLAAVGNGSSVPSTDGKAVKTVAEDSAEAKQDEPKQLDVSMPQDVAMYAAAAQVVLPMQIDGRMQETPDHQSAVMEAQSIQQPIQTKDGDQSAGSLVDRTADTAALANAFLEKAKTPVVTEKIQQVMEAYSQPVIKAADVMPQAKQQVEQRPAEMIDTAKPGLVAPESSKALTSSDFDGMKVVSTDKQQLPTKENRTAEPVVPTVQEQGGQQAATSATIERMPGQSSVDATSPAVQQAVQAAPSVHATVKTANFKPVVQEERIQQQMTSTTAVKADTVTETLLAGAVKQLASVMSGDESLEGNKSEPDQSLVSVVNQIPMHQAKLENVSSTGNTAAPVSNNSAASSEHIAGQVAERLANHEIKNGSEQIVIRLVPENLGELKVSMKMENQRLSVEITTQSSATRDALLQHSDSLKDSLARQNIKMDLFDVSTGANSGGDARSSQNQNVWKELALNRQANQWLQGGYNLPNVAVQQQAAYIPKSQYGMLDVHY